MPADDLRGKLDRLGSAARIVTCALAIAALAHMAGCATNRPTPYQPMTESQRDPAKAQRLTMEAADLIATDLPKSESLLREALSADLYHGPAHNNLGVVYLKQGKLYEAAGELEWARKLMPGHPDPRMNLALVLETAGRRDEAIATYRTALEVYPGHIPTLQALTRLQLRSGKADEHTPEHLSEIALRGETQSWREWARLQLAKRKP